MLAVLERTVLRVVVVRAGCTGVSSLAVMAVYWVLDIRDVQERLACRLFDVDYLDANPDRPHLIWTPTQTDHI